MGREALAVYGLPPGRYELLIDGQPVGTYNHQQLAKHVELQENDKTPQFQQAFAVVELNRQRNETAVKSLRNLWRDKKVLRYTLVQLEARPDDEKLKQAAAKLQESLATFDEQIAKFEAEAKALEDKIFESNQPQPRRYALVRKGGADAE
jgi:hypothetical protein